MQFCEITNVAINILLNLFQFDRSIIKLYPDIEKIVN